MKEKNRIKGHFVLLSTDNTKILIPQADIGQAHYLSKSTKWTNHPTYEGVFLSDDINTSYFVGLSDELTLLQERVDDRFMVLPLKPDHHNNKNILWIWKSIQILINQEFDVTELPAFTMQPQSPILGHVIHEDDVVYFCDTEKLINYTLGDMSL